MTSNALTGWRRVASAMWPAPSDPQIYGQLEIGAAALLAFIERARSAGQHLTVTHLVARALTTALEAVPELNVRIVGSRAVTRPRIEIFFITSMRAGQDDLSGVKVDTTRCNVFELAEQLTRGVNTLRDGHDPSFARAKRTMDRLPRPVLRAALHVSALASERLQLRLPWLGIERSPFGSAIISSVGSLGLPSGFAPLSWMYDVPLLILIGEVCERACVVDGSIVARAVLPLSITIDHRYVDGVHLGRALRALRAYLEDPAAYERSISAP
ncbi:MAG TPA: 2-oxo acid dehydrogenase subunit E2 [Polyangiales bacterium]